MASHRIFIAIDTPPNIKSDMSAVQRTLKESHADVKWEPEEKFHATLKFLGAVDEGRMTAVTSAVEEAAGKNRQAAVTYRSVGRFPPRGTPRVIWIGMENPDGALQQLYQSLDEGMAQLGFERENRDFHPHVTLGRVKGTKNIGGLLRLMESVTFEGRPVTITKVAIVKSELKPSGSIYTTLKSIPLNA